MFDIIRNLHDALLTYIGTIIIKSQSRFCLYRLSMDMTFKLLFSDPHCTYIGPTDGLGFNQIVGYTNWHWLS